MALSSSSNINQDEALQPSVFTDVKEGTYYVDAVNWAVDKKVTSGKTETTFAPNDSCTRAQAVTFLWGALLAAPSRPQAR